MTENIQAERDQPSLLEREAELERSERRTKLKAHLVYGGMAAYASALANLVTIINIREENYSTAAFSMGLGLFFSLSGAYSLVQAYKMAK